MNNPGIDGVVSLFSELLGLPVVLAGGSVRDHMLGNYPKDFDMFILNQNWKEWEEFKKKFIKDHPINLPEVEMDLDWHNSEPFLIKTVRYRGANVQIMTTPCKTMEELVSTFDWGVCCFAFDGKRFVYEKEDLQSIKKGEYLRLNKLTFPFSTLRRGYRFSERYQMRLKQEDLKTICGAIMEKLKDG